MGYVCHRECVALRRRLAGVISVLPSWRCQGLNLALPSYTTGPLPPELSYWPSLFEIPSSHILRSVQADLGLEMILLSLLSQCGYDWLGTLE